MRWHALVVALGSWSGLLLLLLLGASPGQAFTGVRPTTTTTTTTTASSRTARHAAAVEHSNSSSRSAETTRRDLLTQGLALSALLVAAPPAVAAAPQTIVLTGANSGVGYEACVRLLASGGGHTLVLACRSLQKAQETAARLGDSNNNNNNNKLIPAECNLASLASIDAFAQQLPALLGGASAKVDTLCLNAGLCRNVAAKDVARTTDGFELTVGTNHFGHFYLTDRLLPMVQRRIVVTASGVHDPASPGGAQGVPAGLGTLAGLAQDGKATEMMDGSPFNADKAYKDSKLCNVLFTRELQRRLIADGKDISVNCFNPGLIVGTAFFRDQNPLFTKVFDMAATNIIKVGETPSFGGGCLAYMTTLPDSSKGLYYSSPPGSVKYGDAAYGNQFTAETVSVEAQDAAKGQRLWALSAQALGLSV